MMEKNRFEALGLDDALRELNSSRDGLRSGVAQARLSKYGYNQIEDKKKSAYLKFLAKFYGPIPAMLELVIALSYLAGDYRSFYIILALLVFNAVASFLEEHKADDSIELLKSRLTVSSRVLRDGVWKLMQAKYLVPGDMIRVRLGDIVPADAKVVSTGGLEIDQSVLTGESMTVDKESGALVYSGSIVKHGEAECLVVATGYGTYYGVTVRLVQEARSQLHLERAMLEIVKYLIAIDVIVTALLFFFGTVVLGLSLLNLLELAIVILLVSVPVALPAAFTVSMAVGTERLSKKSILVTRLDAIEEASSLDTVCLDKTGTITMNVLQVKDVVPFGGNGETDVVRGAALASMESDRDPIDIAIIDYAKRRNIKAGDFNRLSFVPFEPKTKMSSAVVYHKRERFIVAKGATGVIMGMCSVRMDEKAAIEKKIEELSKRQLRVLAVAMRHESDKGGKYKLLGLVALYDMPRPGAKGLIKEMESLGISVKMLTGDNIAIATEIAREVGMNGGVVDFSQLDGKSEREIGEIAESVQVFAGIFPKDKYVIVRALQARGHRVGMTGDGVNDAPALKQAEVGIAVSNATDVAKSVAELVLTEDGIGVIVDAIKESRRIFERMMTYTMAKISRTIQILFFVAVALFVLRAQPILPFELVLLIFTNDIANIALSTDNVGYSVRPDVWNVRNLMYSSLIFGTALLLISLAFIPIAGYLMLGITAFQTMVLVLFVYSDKLVVFSLRDRAHMWSSRPSAYLVASSVIGVAFAVVISYFGILVAGISAATIAVVFIATTVLMIGFDFLKYATFRHLGIR